MTPAVLSFWFAACLLGGYVCGSIPYGLVLAKCFCGIDPRTAGSCNIGTTNIARLCGKKWGAITLVCDAAKGALPVWVTAWAVHGFFAATTSAALPLLAESTATAALSEGAPLPAIAALLPLAAGAAAIMGHMFPVWLRFKGGKGVATTVGVFLALAPLELIVAAIACLTVIWRTGFVSAGSLVLSAMLPALLFFTGKTATAFLALAISASIVWAHRGNIARLRAGTEKPWSRKQ